MPCIWPYLLVIFFSYITLRNCMSFLILLQEKADIKDKENAKPLRFNGGRIQFQNVHFRCVIVPLLQNNATIPLIDFWLTHTICWIWIKMWYLKCEIFGFMFNFKMVISNKCEIFYFIMGQFKTLNFCFSMKLWDNFLSQC